jgi:cytochrome c-type biogenesis protein
MNTRKISWLPSSFIQVTLYLLVMAAVIVPVIFFAIARIEIGSSASDLKGFTGPFLAFSAGVLSFISPCVLPIVPVYIANLIGSSRSNTQSKISKRKIMSHSGMFLLGLSLVFVLLGTSAGLIGYNLNLHLSTFETIAGLLLIGFGALLIPSFEKKTSFHAAIALAIATGIFYLLFELNFLKNDWQMAFFLLAILTIWAKYCGYLKFAFFQRTLLVEIPKTQTISYGRSALFGMAFAVGWTPCIGPILGGILTLAAASGEALTGLYLLLFYSLGFSMPFLITSIVFTNVGRPLKKLSKLLPITEALSAVIIITLGALLLAGRLTKIYEYFDFAGFNQGL